jgi:hypothetical protein
MRGARYVQGQKLTYVVVVDENLVTGQNGASSKRTAQAVVDQVDKMTKRKTLCARSIVQLRCDCMRVRLPAPNLI